MTVSSTKFQEVREAIESHPYFKGNISHKKSLSFPYLRYRLMRPVLKSRYNQYQKANPQEPWLCPDAIKALKQLLPGSNTGLEYGSGRSTAFFAPYFQRYVSIEHEPNWYEKVKGQITELLQVEYHLIPAEKEAPQQHLSSEQQIFLSEEEFPIPDEVFKTYSDFILKFEDESFDFVLIDGRARRTCALNAISKLKSGGLLVLDNSERVRYAKVHEALNGWSKLNTRKISISPPIILADILALMFLGLV